MICMVKNYLFKRVVRNSFLLKINVSKFSETRTLLLPEDFLSKLNFKKLKIDEYLNLLYSPTNWGRVLVSAHLFFPRPLKQPKPLKQAVY